MTTEQLGLVVVGAGWAGERQARAVHDRADTRLAAVVDPDHDRAADLAARWGDAATTIHANLDTIVAEDRARSAADAMIICSPTALHADHATVALEHGIPCLVEKPFAATTDQVSALAELAERTGTPIMAAQLLRSMPMFTWAAEMVTSGRLGTPIQVIERRLEDRRAGHDWWSALPAFLVAHWGSHTIDLVSHLFEAEHSEVRCVASSTRFAGVVDGFTAQIEFAGGPVMTTTMSLASRHEVHDLVIIGTEATLSFDCYRTARLDDQLIMDLSEEETYRTGFATQLEAFVDAVRTGRTTVGTVASVLRSLRVVAAAEDAALAAGIRGVNHQRASGR